MTKQLPNEILVRHSLWDWIRIFDRMRADRYAFLQPIGKYSVLEDLLEIETFMPENDRNTILRNTIWDDYSTWDRPLIYKARVRPTPAYLHNGNTWSEKYPEIHGQKGLLLPTTNNLSNLMLWNKSWSQIIRAIYGGIYQNNGFVYLNAYSGIYYGDYNEWFTTYHRRCNKHEDTTPVGKWKEFTTRGNSTFGCWQKVQRAWENDGWNGVEVYSTEISRLKIENFTPPFDGPYRIVIAGIVDRFIQFDGMGFVEYPGCYNVIFDSGPIQGNYTSPLIGPDSYPLANLDYFKETGKTGSAGWKIDYCDTFILPAEGAFPDYF